MIPMLALAAVAALASPTSSLPNVTCGAASEYVGTRCLPAATGRHPAILLLGGSEGGDTMGRTAAQWASRGYVASSVVYFGAPGLPQSLQNIPVETIGKAIASTLRRDDVDPDRLAILGVSKGGELALLTAALYPQIHAVVADVPSPFAWQGIPNAPNDAAVSSWTFGGKPLPYVPYTAAMGSAIGDAFGNRKPLDLRPAYDNAMQNSDAVSAAMFPLEKIAGPVLFLAADDDRVWDSVAQSDLGIRYLSEHKHPYADRSVHYPHAGHLFLFSTAARPMLQAPFGGGIEILFGGTAVANVAARAAAWPTIVAFVDAAWQARGTK